MSPRQFLRFIVTFDLLLILISTCLGLIKTGNPSRYFGEGRFTTFFSAAQLIAIGVFAWLIFRQRGNAPVASPSGAPLRSKRYFVWALIAAGFIFLAADEIWEIHEKLDRVILKALSLPKTPLTGRLDDAIVGAYGVIGLLVLWICRREVLPFWKVMKGPLTAGFIGLFLMVLCDTAAHDDHFFHWLTGDLATAKKLNGWFSTFEGALTLFSEGLFIAAFHAAWKQARTENHLTPAVS